jgi:ferredoxin-NADP reductase
LVDKPPGIPRRFNTAAGQVAVGEGGSAMSVEPDLRMTVLSRATKAEGVISLCLASVTGARLPEWQPGAHIDLVLGEGLIRQYSLTSDPQQRSQWEIAVLLEPAGRGGSRIIFDRLWPGSDLRVRGPRNHFALHPARQYLFIAGGIGITPIRPMLAAAEARGADWRLLYGGRSGCSMAFVYELLELYGPERVQVRPQDIFGLLDVAGYLERADDGALVYCCGPEPLLEAVEQHCAATGLNLHTERFTAPPVQTPLEDQRTFEVELARTGTTITVAAGVSILSAAEQAGALVTSSCEEGTCGSCQTTVLAGKPLHRDWVLGAPERASGDTMMICVSRSEDDGKLVLDL